MKLDETKRQKIIHPIPPLYDKDSKILILGSFPSVKSREEAFFYGHKQNRFWKLLAGILSEKKPETVEEKKDFLHRNCIAVWDVIHSCDIIGSSDSSIRNVVPNDLSDKSWIDSAEDAPLNNSSETQNNDNNNNTDMEE